MKDQPRFIIHSNGTIEQIIESCEDAISRDAVEAIIDDAKKEIESEKGETYG